MRTSTNTTTSTTKQFQDDLYFEFSRLYSGNFVSVSAFILVRLLLIYDRALFVLITLIVKMSVLKHFQECRSLQDYLATLPADVLQELYTFPSACLAIFRELPKLAQHHVLRILYVEQVVPQAVMATWVTKSYAEEHKQAVDALNSLHIWNESAMPGGLPGWILDAKFRHNLKIALLGGGNTWTNSAHLETDNKQRTIKDLDSYALGRWEALLHFLTEKSQQEDSVSKDTLHTLQHAGLMQTNKGEKPTITNEGFQFLLLDTASQVWYFIVKYLETAEGNVAGLRLAECLAFLFSLSQSTLGNDYSTEGFSEPMQTFMQHLREFGLLYQRTRKAGRFYPTRLAMNLTSRNRHVALDTEKHKTAFLIVETNYRVYAFTDSELQLALVGMFTDFIFRLPNMAVGVISRGSVTQALRNGISAEQIISYLKMHAHPEMIKSSPSGVSHLPPSVVDQIKLWEIERNRLTYEDSALYNQFLSHTDYEVVRNYAQEIDVLVYSNDQKRTVIVSGDGHDSVRKFWKKHSKKMEGSQ